MEESQQILTCALQAKGNGFDTQQMAQLKLQLEGLQSEECQVSAVFLWIFGCARPPADDALELDSAVAVLQESVFGMLHTTSQPLFGVATGWVGHTGTHLLKICDYVFAVDSAQFSSICSSEIDPRVKSYMSVQQASHIGLIDTYAPVMELNAKLRGIVQKVRLLGAHTVAALKADLIDAKMKIIERSFREQAPPGLGPLSLHAQHPVLGSPSQVPGVGSASSPDYADASYPIPGRLSPFSSQSSSWQTEVQRQPEPVQNFTQETSLTSLGLWMLP